MAAPIIESFATYVQETAIVTHSVTMPSGITAGDLLLVLDRNIEGFAAPSGWTRVRAASSGVWSAFHYRTADGTEGATVDFTMANSNARRAACVTLRVSGWTSFENQFVDEDSLNPPSITPTWGDTFDTLWIAVGAGRPTTNVIDSAPTNFSLVAVASHTTNATNDRTTIGAAQQSVAAASLDADAFGATGSFTDSNAWVIAVQGSSSARWGFRITGIKEPNVSDTLVTGVSNATAVVWTGDPVNDAATPSDYLESQSITSGEMEIELTYTPSETDSAIIAVDWDAGGGETKYFRATPTIIDLDA